MGVVALALAVLSQGQRRTWDADRDRGAPVWAGPLDGLRAVWCSAPLRAIALAAFCFAGLYEVLGSYRTAFLLLGLLGAAGGLLALFALRRAAAAAR